jgi:hypothetical protein
MMRRLHFEEAQQSHFAINAARESGEIKDDNESKSLAEEFSALLAQMSGPVGAMPDQVSALGFALAQSAAPQKAKHEDPYRDEKQCDANKHDEDPVTSDDLSNQDKSLSVTVGGFNKPRERKEDNTSENKVESQDSSDTREQVVAQGGEEIQKVSDIGQALKIDNTEVSLSTESLTIEADDSDGPVEVNSNITGLTDQEIVECTDEEDASTDQVATSSNNQDIGRIIKSDKEKNKDEGQADDADLFAVTTQAQTDRDQGAENVRKHDGSGKSKESAERELNARENSVSDTSLAQTKQQLDQKAEVSSRNGAQDEWRVNADERKSADSQKTLKNSDVKHEEASFDGFNHNPEFQSPTKPGGETIQTVMLRHTFETIRASLNEGADTQRVRPQSQTVQGLGAANEAKSAQNEGANRGRPLTRPQITRMLERVESTLKEAARSRDGKTLSLRLEPVDLGKVKVDVSLRDGALHARISPENQQVMQNLREHAHELQGALRKLGLDVDSVSVSITADEFNGEMASGQGSFDGSSFQHERNNMPQERAQLAENTIGNKLAESLNASGESRTSKALEMVDHWIA